MTLVAVSGFYLDVPEQAIPSPPSPLAGIVKSFVSSDHGAVSTGSMAFEPSGVKQAVTVGSACRIRVEVTGIFGHNMPGAIVYACLVRTKDTGEVHPLKAGANLAAGKIPSALDFAPFRIDRPDEIDCAGSYEYELYLRQSSSAPGSIGYAGRRGQDTDPNIDTVISLTVLDP